MGQSGSRQADEQDDEDAQQEYHSEKRGPPADDGAAAAAPVAPEAAAAVKLYKYDPSVKEWKLAAAPVQPEYEEDVEGLGNAKFMWYLTVEPEVSVLVNDNCRLHADARRKMVSFVAESVWALRFRDDSRYNKFLQDWQGHLFENTYQVAATDAGRKKIFGEEFMDWAQGQDAEGAEFGTQDEDETEPDEVTYDEQKAGHSTGPEASYLELGALDNSFVIRGSGVDVYRNILNGVQSAGVSVNLRDPSGASITPMKAMLAQRERTLLMMSPERRKGVYQMDIETEKVVAEWTFKKDGADIGMRDIQSDTKSAQLEERDTFLGLDDNRLARWDMRDAKGMVQQLNSTPVLGYAGGHDFSRGTNFRCMATTGDGSVAVGSEDGKIRLYNDRTLSRAKTAFPGLGAPMTAIDVTYNGHWVLATTNSYLLVLSAAATDKTGPTTGFKARLGAKIAAPRLLKLHLEDVIAMNRAPLRDARFSWVTENGKKERWVVASVGNDTVVWNFTRVKDRSHECYIGTEGLKTCYCYRLIPKSEQVVASEFMHDRHSSGDGQLVVATPHDVYSYTARAGRRSSAAHMTPTR
eukprot:jgi/Chlat1/8288/Chrsp78S07705